MAATPNGSQRLENIAFSVNLRDIPIGTQRYGETGLPSVYLCAPGRLMTAIRLKLSEPEHREYDDPTHSNR